MKEEFTYTSVRLPKRLLTKLSTAAEELGTNRNRLLTQMIEGLTVKSRPAFEAKFEKETRNAIAYQGQGEAGLSAN